MDDPDDNPVEQRHVWSWIVVAAFILGVALAILWMSVEVRRTKEQREPNSPLPAAPSGARP